MKKTLIALAAVAVTSTAMAQVTLSGTFNLDSQNTMSEAQNKVGMGDIILKFAASEDLGGGMKIAVNTTIQGEGGRGGTTSGNGYGVSLTGGFGGLSLNNYLNANNLISAGVSAEDDMNDVIGSYTFRTRLQYALPTFYPGVSASLRLDETATAATAATDFVNTSTADLKYQVGYATGPFSINIYGAESVGYTDMNASYDAGFAQFTIGSQDTDDHNEFAIVAPIGANLSAGLHLIDSDVTEAVGARLTYAMSKRTSLAFHYVDASVSSVSGKDGDNYRLRLAHTF
jgi:hypothetical protein